MRDRECAVTHATLDMPEDPYREIVSHLNLDHDFWTGFGNSDDLRDHAEHFLRLNPWAEPFVRPALVQCNGDLSDYRLRSHFRRVFAYAIPSPWALEAIAGLGTIVEIGAGSGYWASLLARHGATVHAFDNASWGLPPRWYPVQRGGAVAAGRVDADALLLCWPPYDNRMAANALRAFQGPIVAYIGEGEGGCTADDAFHATLERSWSLRREVSTPQFYGLHDHLFIYDREETPCKQKSSSTPPTPA